MELGAAPRALLAQQRRHWAALNAGRASMLAEQRAGLPKGATIGQCQVLAAELADPADSARLLGSNTPLTWRHQAWALNPDNGSWYLAVHQFVRPPKERLRGQACGVCAGYDVDATTSPATWVPHLAAQYDDPRVPFAALPLGLHNAGGKWQQLADPATGLATLRWRCRWHGEFFATMANRTHTRSGGTGCPRCGPRELSKEQLRLACEIAHLLPSTEVGP